MKNKQFPRFIFIVFGFVPWLLYGQKAVNPGAEVKLGVSQINITPETPVLMSGYEARKTPYTRVHDELYASALYFDGNDNDLLVITADLSGFSDSFIDEIRSNISSKINIPAQNIMISATHTHGGPIGTYRDNYTGAAAKYSNALKGKLLKLAVEASDTVVPFRMGMAKGSSNMNICRRAIFADGIMFLGKNPEAPCDHTLDVVKFEDINHRTMAILINWPCHGTAGGEENYEITADWPGGVAQTIKKQIGNDVVVAVTAGASADVDPIYAYSRDFREIDAVGYHVGTEALNILSRITTFPVKPDISVKNEIITFSGRKEGKDYLPPTTFEKGPDVSIRLTTFKIGNLILAGISGELMTEIGIEVKKRSPYTATLIVTHCNGDAGYICTDKAFSEGGYEIKVTNLMPGVEKPLIMKFIEIINSL